MKRKGKHNWGENKQKRKRMEKEKEQDYNEKEEKNDVIGRRRKHTEKKKNMITMKK